MTETDCGIYLLYDNENPNRIYIGSTTSFKRRIREHFYRLKNGTHHNKKLQRFVNKYGIDRLSYCKFYDCKEKDLEKWESEEIQNNKSFSKHGFNMTENAHRHNLETRRILSMKAKERQSDPEVKERLKIQNSGINNPCSKLTNEDVKYIRKNFIRISPHNSNINEMAKLFNVHRKTINRIILNQTYKNE